jgi:hypothetical protein
MGSPFAWAIEQKKFKIKANPCRDVKKPKHMIRNESRMR